MPSIQKPRKTAGTTPTSMTTKSNTSSVAPKSARSAPRNPATVGPVNKAPASTSFAVTGVPRAPKPKAKTTGLSYTQAKAQGNGLIKAGSVQGSSILAAKKTAKENQIAANRKAAKEERNGFKDAAPKYSPNWRAKGL